MHQKLDPIGLTIIGFIQINFNTNILMMKIRFIFTVMNYTKIFYICHKLYVLARQRNYYVCSCKIQTAVSISLTNKLRSLDEYLSILSDDDANFRSIGDTVVLIEQLLLVEIFINNINQLVQWYNAVKWWTKIQI